MIPRPPRSTRTSPLFPYTTLFRADGAVDDAGDRHRILDPANEAPIGGAPIHLVAGAPVDRHHLRAQILCDPREFGRVQAVMVPPHAHLDGHPHRHRLDTGVDPPGSQRTVTHQHHTPTATGYPSPPPPPVPSHIPPPSPPPPLA